MPASSSIFCRLRASARLNQGLRCFADLKGLYADLAVIGILIGLVWGIGEGFVILAAGTFIGEILLWFSFKWCCTNAAAKFEKKNRLYWSLTQLIREKVCCGVSLDIVIVRPLRR